MEVEDSIFQVPKHHFAANEVFSITFTLPPPGGTSVEGSSEGNPFELVGILKKDFQAFLSVIYPLQVPFDYADITVEQWRSVLELSHMWDFQSLRDLSIQKLGAPGSLESITKIQLGEKYHISEWFVSGCVDLVMRDKGPRANEVNQLGTEMAVQLSDLREERIIAQLRRYSFNPPTRIRKAFEYVLGPE
ncbi:hypothetical protein BDZ97DRAFT_1666562 [Flammula alnicola]|nr:hypothetical protein BDZ97DRAFT_1666562 [Flammula alnicola]